MEYPIRPVEGTWSELLPDDADRDSRVFFALLDAGAVELWQREDGVVHAYEDGAATYLCTLPVVPTEAEPDSRPDPD